MESTYNEVIDDFARWVVDKRGPNFGLAHIRGSPGQAKSRVVPMHIWRSLLLRHSNTSIIHVVADFKKSVVEEERAPMTEEILGEVSQSGVNAMSEVRTLTYLELLHELKRVRKDGRWNFMSSSILDLEVVVLMEVDPDFSAEFVLALNAAVAFTVSFVKEQSKAALRLATLSWEKLHPLVRRLFVEWGEENIRDFQLPQIHNATPTTYVDGGDQEKILGMIKSYIDASPEKSHAIFYFKDDDKSPVEWRNVGWLMDETKVKWEPLDHEDGLIFEEGEKHKVKVIRLYPRHRIPGMLSQCDSVHIVPGEVSRRVIYDRMTRQMVTVSVRLSRSEREQQVAWKSRFRVQPGDIYVYSRPDYLDLNETDTPRRMDAVDSQVGGFIAALAEFEGWPEKTMAILEMFDQRDRGAIEETIRRFKIQGLLQSQSQDSTAPLSLALPESSRELFFELLPMVGFDARIAHFLLLPTGQELLQVRLQVAAALTMGSQRLATIDVGGLDMEGLDAVRSMAMTGFTAHIARYGTLWARLGMMKRLLGDTIPDLQSGINHQGRVKSDAIDIFQDKDKDLVELFGKHGITVTPPNYLSEVEYVHVEQLEELCWDLLRAFSGQIAVVHIRDNDPIMFADIVSKTLMEPSNRVVYLLPWDEFKERGRGIVVGFYTALSRDSEGKMPVVLDWNWIPTNIWLRWSRKLKERYTDGLRTLIKKGGEANEDEV